MADVKEQLNAGEAARDVATAESLLKNHHDLSGDIRAHQDECVPCQFPSCFCFLFLFLASPLTDL